MEKNRGILRKYYDYPESIRRSIHSTNLIENINKENWQRINDLDSLPSEESAMKNVYLRYFEVNEKSSRRSLKGLYKCMDEIRKCSRRGLFKFKQLSGRYIYIFTIAYLYI